jgi:hypothetical protein
MFDLEKAIAEWRRHMAAGGVKSHEILNELESHLRDEFEKQLRIGQSGHQAFEIASRSIGKSSVLAIEFEKAKETKEASERKIKLICVIFVAVLYLVPFALSIPKPWNGLEPIYRLPGLSAVALTILSIFGGLFAHPFLPIIPDKQIRTRVQFACATPVFIWLIIFAFVILPRLDLTIGQVTVATLWAIYPLALLGGLILGLDEAARRRSPKTA